MVTKKDIFDNIRQTKGSLTQKQVDAGDKIMSIVDITLLAEFLGISTSTVSTYQLTKEMLLKVYPKANVNFVDVINKYAPLFELNTKVRMNAYLSQVLVESAGFNHLRENMNYSAQRLLQVFPKYFKDLKDAQSVVSKGQVEIANRVYGKRMGNIAYEDGFNFRGGGLIHTTGRTNYTTLNTEIKKYIANIDVVNKPDTIMNVDCAVLASMIYWKSRNINVAADKGDIVAVSKLVNGGTNGLEERKSIYEKLNKL